MNASLNSFGRPSRPVSPPHPAPHLTADSKGQLFATNFMFTFQHIRASLVAQLVKNPPVIWETWVQSLGSGRSPREEKGFPLHYSSLENSMDCTVHGVTKSQTQLSDLRFNTLRLIFQVVTS